MTETQAPNTEIEVEHDALISEIEARKREEHARQCDAGDSAALTREFLDATGLDSQAFSWLKSIMKKLPKKDGAHKAMRIIRSLKVGLPMVENHVLGQQPELNLDADEEEDEESEPSNVTSLQTKPEPIEPFDPEEEPAAKTKAAKK